MKNIKEIHNSNLYGTIIEAGCSATIASTLMNEPGSSKTVYRAEQPYSKEYQESLYGKFKRSVSKEWIKQVLEVESKKSDKINFVLASSWQLIDPNDPLVYAHGWFGLYDMQRNVKHYLHFSFRRDFFRAYREVDNDNSATIMWSGDKNEYIEHKYAYDLADRKTLLDIIGKLACNILHTAISGDIKSLVKLHAVESILDNAYIDNGIVEEINYDLLISTLEKANGDYFLVFDKGEVIRIEDLMRKSNEFVIQKGSYEIFHHAHLQMMKMSLDKYTNSVGAYLISSYRYDKPHLSSEEIIKRIKPINELGFPVIICKSVLFYETFDLLKKWSYGKKFQFPIGTDTINRILKTDKENSVDIQNIVNTYKDAFNLLLFNRLNVMRDAETILYDPILSIIDEYNDDGISSTAIKKGTMNNLL